MEELFEIKDEILIKYNGNSDTIYIPNGIKEIGYHSINLSNIKNIYIPKTVKIIRDLEKSELGNKENIINFYFNHNFHDFCKIDDDVSFFNAERKIYFKKDRKYVCLQDLEEIVIPDDITKICEFKFSELHNLKKVTLGKKIKFIDTGTFCYCNNLKEIIFNDSLKRIGESAFKNTGLGPIINLPSSLDYIGLFAFDDCSNLKTIYANKEKLKVVSDFELDKDSTREFKRDYLNIDILDYDKDYNNKINSDIFEAIHAISLSFINYKYLDDTFKKNEVILKQIIGKEARNVCYIDKELYSNKDFIIKLVKVNPRILFFIDNDYSFDKDVFLATLERSSYIFHNEDIEKVIEKYFDSSLWNDKQLVIKAVQKNHYFFEKYVPEKLRMDRDVFLQRCKKSPTDFLNYDHPFKKDAEFILEVLNENYPFFGYYERHEQYYILDAADYSLRNSREFMLKAIGINGFAFKYASDFLKMDSKFCLEVIKISPRAYRFFDNRLFLYFDGNELRNEIIKINKDVLKFTEENLMKLSNKEYNELILKYK